ncbi:MAG TPA: hypothetical protein VGL86_24745 [Polyangia bacterium]|jgi:hypothetical protein
MRAAIFAVACVVAAGCVTKDKCKQDTVLVSTTFDSVAAAADELDVVVQLDQQAMMTATLPGPGGHASGNIEVDFPGGYHVGSTLQVSVSARLAGVVVANGESSATLAAGCGTLALDVVSSGSDGGGDGGAPPDLGMADMIMLPVPAIAAKPDLVGFTTSLDGSGSTDSLGDTLTLTWTIDAVPTGSAITTAALSSTSASKVTFEPDRGGVYKIALTAAAPDGRTATITSNVTVPTVPLFYVRAGETTTTSSFGAHVFASDGTGEHAIGCDVKSDGGIDESSIQTLPFVGHAWEPPTLGTAQPLYAFLAFVDTSSPPAMVVGSIATNCTTSPPIRVDNNVFNDHIPVTARFSPDGTRIVYVDMPEDSSQGTYRLVTVAVDGVGPKHVVRSDGYFGFTPAIWLDNQTVAWLERDTSDFNPFTIYSAPDANAAGDPASNMRTQVLRCDQSTTSTHLAEINQFEMSPFGMIVAGSTSTRDVLEPPPFPAVNIYRLATGDCSIANPNAKTMAAEPIGGLSWDFSLSPDGLTILFSSTHTEAVPDGGLPEPQTDIFLMPSDASAAPQKIAGDPLYDDTSPRYIAGGRQFTWSRTQRNRDMVADTPAVMIANADGTHVHAFVPTPASGERVIATEIGANRGYDCSGVPGTAGATATTAFIGALALLLLALRPRRRG